MTSENDQQTIEAAFVDSWDGIEKFYARIITRGGLEWLNPIFDLIAKFRERDYDRQFRAGQSLHIFILSRSLRHGLRDDQPSLSIMLRNEGGMQLGYYEPPNANIEMDVDRVEITPEVEEFLTRLLAHPIN